MDEIRTQPEEIESSEARSVEQQALDDATYDPRALIEQGGDYQQAETIQATLTAVVENASAARDLGVSPLPLPRPEDGSVMGSLPGVRGDLDQVTVTGSDTPGGEEATPIPLPGQETTFGLDLGATPLPIPRPEDGSVMGSLPEVRGDLDQVTMGEGDNRHEAMPIPLPGVLGQAVEEGHPPMPQDHEAGPQGDETEAEWLERLAAGRTLAGIEEQDTVLGSLPSIRGDLDQVTVTGSDTPGGEEATPIPLPGQEGVAASPAPALSESAGQPEKPLQEANHGKPILHQEPEDLDRGLGGLDDLDSLISGPGKIGGVQGGEGMGSDAFSDLLGGIPGLGFGGGPSDLKNDPGGPGSDLPPGGHDPFSGAPGAVMMGGGRNAFWGWNFYPDRESQYQGSKELTAMEDAETANLPSYDPNWEAVPKTELMDPFDDTTPATSSDYAEQEKEMAAFTKAQKQMDAEKEKQKEAAEKGKGAKCEPDEGGGKSGLITPQAQKTNPKFDQSHISNYPEDHIAGNQGGGTLKPEAAEIVERTLENKDKLANASPKAGAEQITDPPEHDPGKKSEVDKQEG